MSDRLTRRVIAEDLGPGLTRVQLVKWGAAAGGALAAGGLVAGGLPMPPVSQPSAAQDRRVLEWLVQVEHLQADFYTEAERRGALSGELRELSKLVGEQDRAHVAALERALGGAGSRRAAFDFGDATREPQRFLAAAVELEELALAPFNGQVPNLTKRRILTAMGIAAVEARHVGWLRDLAGRNPAPRPADVPATGRDEDGDRGHGVHDLADGRWSPSSPSKRSTAMEPSRKRWTS